MICCLKNQNQNESKFITINVSKIHFYEKNESYILDITIKP